LDPRFESNKVIDDKYFYYDCAISDGKEKILYITKDGQNSSLFVPDMKYYKDDRIEFDCMEVVDSKPVKCKSLAKIIEQSGHGIDVLKIDAQGSEYDILKNVKNYMNQIIVIHLEMWLKRCYEGIPLLNVVHDFLSACSFVPARIINKKSPKWREVVYINTSIVDNDKIQLVKKLYKIDKVSAYRANLEINEVLSCLKNGKG